jgi:hypothetical protein
VSEDRQRRGGIGRELGPDSLEADPIARRQKPRARISLRAIVGAMADFVMAGLTERHGLRLQKGHAVLGEVAAGGEEEILVLRRRIEQRLVQLQPKGDCLAHQLRVVIPGEHIAARGERAGDHANGLVLHQRTPRQRCRQAGHQG